MSSDKTKAVVQLSGGLDSTACALIANQDYDAHALFIDYGQVVVAQEEKAARYVADKLSMPFHKVTLQGIQFTGGDYVPVRNFIIAAVSLNLAESIGADAIIVGNKTKEYREDDPWCWKDCTVNFFHHLTQAARAGIEQGEPEYLMPLAGLDRQQVTALVNDKGEPFGISKPDTWSCYTDGDEPCGTCFHCREERGEV